MTQRDTTAYFRNLKKHGLPHFTLDSFKDLRETLKKDRMSVTTEFQEHLISAEFDGKVIQHRIFLRDPIDIMKEVIRDDSTRQHMLFYPVKKFKRTGNPPFRKVTAYDELWTTKRWWKLQDLLPNHNGCIGAIILYSDGTNAVKFGQKTVHPIYMWLGNVPLRERSASGKEGCQLIGFQPEADLAELCPVCLVPKEHLHLISHQFPKRTVEQAQFHLEQYRQTEQHDGATAAVKELTSTSSLRPEKSAFYRLRCSDVYDAIAADSLHVFGGLYKDHIMQKIFEKLSTAKNEKVHSYLLSLPPYGSLRHVPKRGLTSLESFTCMEIQDAMKNWQCLIVAMIGILPAEIEQEVIPALRSLAVFELLVKMHVQEEDQIAVLRNEKISSFEAALKTLHEHFGMSTKFPKGHLPVHFVHMISKGGTLDHQTTAHGERAHCPLKETFIARAVHSTIDGETEESMAHRAFELMQLQAIQRRVDAANASQLDCSAIQQRRDLINALRLFLLRLMNPSTPARVRQQQLPQIDRSMICDYTLFRCPFNSWMDEREYEDLIRCHPDWQTSGKPRYNDVIIRNEDCTISFGQLVRLFSCRVDGREFQLLLLREYQWVGRHHLSGMPFLKEQEVFRFHLPTSIVRSRYVQPDPIDDGFYHVNDLAEADLFLRFQNLS
ncbi:hypothetical protein BT69DRAFT_1298609 [Atractiella rhizophila]|nr:hypothetical protein BT69DRAFT_1298609 [Atractiella rhizophila]